MGISVEGQKCPICSGYLFENDDLVFCPTCGAPHHRDCYAAIGRCGLSDLHGTAQQFKAPKPEEKKKPTAAEEPANAVRYCPTCGETFSYNEQVCPHCGTPAAPQGVPFGFVPPFDPFGGVGKDEQIEGVPATELQVYVAVNTARYLPRFKRLNRGNRLSWNWAAFLFPGGWFFMRKIYLPGILFFLLSLTAGGLTSAVNVLLAGLPDEAQVNYSVLFQYLTQNLSGLNPWPIYLSLMGSVLALVVRITAGLFGDWLYRSSAIDRIRKIQESDSPDEPTLTLRQKGGVNLVWGLLGLFAQQWLIYWLYLFL